MKKIALFAVILMLTACTTTKKEEAKKEEPKKEAIVFSTIYFNVNDASILSEELDKISANADLLKDNPEIRVIIEGHCDERGTPEYNYNLGKERAMAAKNKLVEFGVDPSRIEVVSFGEEKPAVVGTDEEVWSKNRRCEFKII